jgi:hypothetical protein
MATFAKSAFQKVCNGKNLPNSYIEKNDNNRRDTDIVGDSKTVSIYGHNTYMDTVNRRHAEIMHGLERLVPKSENRDKMVINEYTFDKFSKTLYMGESVPEMRAKAFEKFIEDYQELLKIFEFFITCETVKDCELFEYDHRFDSIYNKVGMPILIIRPVGLQILQGFANFSCSNIKNGLKAYYELMKFQNCILKKNCCE